MVTYISLLKFTDQGVKAIKDSPNRLEAYIKSAKAAGVKTLSVHYTMGSCDIVLISEAPDEATLMKVLLNQLTFGNVSAQSMRAYSPAQMKEFMKDLA